MCKTLDAGWKNGTDRFPYLSHRAVSTDSIRFEAGDSSFRFLLLWFLAFVAAARECPHQSGCDLEGPKQVEEIGEVQSGHDPPQAGNYPPRLLVPPDIDKSEAVSDRSRGQKGQSKP